MENKGFQVAVSTGLSPQDRLQAPPVFFVYLHQNPNIPAFVFPVNRLKLEYASKRVQKS